MENFMGHEIFKRTGLLTCLVALLTNGLPIKNSIAQDKTYPSYPHELVVEKASAKSIQKQLQKFVDSKQAAYVLVITYDKNQSKLFAVEESYAKVSKELPVDTKQIVEVSAFTWVHHRRNPCCITTSGFLKWRPTSCYTGETKTLIPQSQCY